MNLHKRDHESPHEREIRVLRIIARMNIGGPAIQIVGLMNGLNKEIFKQLLVTGYCEADEIDYLVENKVDVPIHRINGFGRRIDPFSDLKVLWEIRKVIKSFNPDIIHTHTAKAGLLGRLASLTLIRPQIRVHTFHGHLLHGYFSKTKTALIVLIERLLAKYSTNLIAVGSQVKDDLIHARIGTNEKFRVIGPGLSLNNLPARSRVEEKFEIPSSKFHVSWVGRAVSIKAPHRILEIAQECKRMRIDVDFLIVGDGPLLNDLKMAANLSSLSIRFLGWQSEIEPILSITDLMILTSLNEGTPVSLIQAQLAGIPVLTTDVGSASEVLVDGKSGFCLEYSPVSFAMKIEELFSNDQLSKEMGESAKTFAMSKFSVERLVGDHTALYLNVINQSNF